MATVHTDVNSLYTTHPQRDVAIAVYYAPRGVVYTDDPLKPVGDQARLNRVWKVYDQVDQKSA